LSDEDGRILLYWAELKDYKAIVKLLDTTG